MLNVFRVNFFKKKNEEIQKDVKGQPMKANPDSKTSARKKLRLLRNRERRAKHKAIMKQKNLAKKLGNKKNKGLESK